MHPQDTTDAPDASAEAEEWRPVPGYEGWYSVSSLGHLRRDKSGCGTRAGHIHTAYKNKESYLFVCMSRHGKNDRRAIHILVATAFLGPVPAGYEVDHKDGDPTNNRLGNLEYVSHVENLARAVQRRIAASGSPSPNTRLSADDVRAIRASTESQYVLARRYGLRQGAISNIQRGKRWKHLI